MTDSVFQPLEEEGGWLLLAEVSMKDRIAICYVSANNKKVKIALFHEKEQPNRLSKKMTKIRWGWLTYYTPDMQYELEAHEVLNLYIQDMENDNFWWEADRK